MSPVRLVGPLLAIACAFGPALAAAQSLAEAPRPQVFAGLSLAAALNAAVASSPDVAGAQARYDQSRTAFASARGGLAPALVGSYVQVPQGNPPDVNITSRQGTLGLQWTLGDFLAYGPAVREAALTLSAAQADRDAAVAAEKVKVTALYLDALKARAVAEARRSAFALSGTLRAAAAARVRAGDAPQLDVVRADVAQAKAEADLESARAVEQSAADALQMETGAEAGAFGETTPAQFPALNPLFVDPAVVRALALKQRPEVKAARLTADAADAAIRSARAAGFPAITVTGGFVTGTDSGVAVNAPSVNANFTLPLSRAARDKVAIAVFKAVEARSKAAAAERQIALDSAASARTLAAAQRSAAALSRARQSAAVELNATEIGYRGGASSSLELTSARSTYVQAVVDELAAIYDFEKARAQLEIEVGQ